MVVSVRAGHRRKESQNGLEHLGVPLENQIYLDLPDGELAQTDSKLTSKVTQFAGRLGITHFHTLGCTGYDGHADHIATHEATVLAAKQLAQPDITTVLALNAGHEGDVRVQGDYYQKIGAMACHISQFALHDEAFWQEFAPYVPLITQGETYDQLQV